MYTQQLVFVEGGAKTVMGETLEECLTKTKEVSTRLYKSLFGVTCPYPIEKVEHGELKLKVWDVSIPMDWREDLGKAFIDKWLDIKDTK